MILKYQKVTDEFTTHALREPDYKEGDPRVTELCTIGDETYVHVPDDLVLPEQAFNIDVTMEAVTLTGELKAEIKALSPHVKLINARVVEKIREKYSQDDELKAAHAAGSPFAVEFLAYRDQCIAWGNAEKAKIGL
jgi:hypothetical protein